MSSPSPPSPSPLFPPPLSGALTRHRPIRGWFVDSPGCSLGVVLISQRPYTTSQTDEKLDKSTILSLLLSHTHARILFLLLSLSVSRSPPFLPPPLHFAFLSRSHRCRQGEQPRIVSTLLSLASSKPLSSKRTFARVRRTANKNDNFSWSSRNTNTCKRLSCINGKSGKIMILGRIDDPVWLVAVNIDAFVVSL